MSWQAKAKLKANRLWRSSLQFCTPNLFQSPPKTSYRSLNQTAVTIWWAIPRSTDSCRRSIICVQQWGKTHSRFWMHSYRLGCIQLRDRRSMALSRSIGKLFKTEWSTRLPKQARQTQTQIKKKILSIMASWFSMRRLWQFSRTTPTSESLQQMWMFSLTLSRQTKCPCVGSSPVSKRFACRAWRRSTNFQYSSSTTKQS